MLIAKWAFADPPNLGVIPTVRVLEEGLPILLVTHDEDDGGWQFLCGTTNDAERGRIVGLDSIVPQESFADGARRPPARLASLARFARGTLDRAAESPAMKLTWWLKAALLGLVTALAALVVAPSVVPADRLVIELPAMDPRQAAEVNGMIAYLF